MAQCKECGHDHHEAAIRSERRAQELMLYNKALHLACDGNKDRVQALVEQVIEIKAASLGIS